VWDVSPVIFEFGALQLRYYGILFILGFIVSYFILKKIYEKEDIPLKELDLLSGYVLIGGLVGARIGHCVFYDWEYFSNHILEIFLPVTFEPEFRFVGYQGLASHGGAIGVIIAVLLFVKKSVKRNFFWLIDRIAIPTGFAGALIRIGNLMNSEIYGHQTNLPWGFIFAENGDVYASHPTQIYEALCYIATSILLMRLYKEERFRNAKGFLLGVFFIMVFTARFFIEFLKENQVAFEETMSLNMGQILSIPLVVTGIFLIVWSRSRYKKETQSVLD
jgi:prolipoprotein diacylglyceryl transferase